MNVYGVPKQIKSDKGGAFISKEGKNFAMHKISTVSTSPPNSHWHRIGRTYNPITEEPNFSQPGRRTKPP